MHQLYCIHKINIFKYICDNNHFMSSRGTLQNEYSLIQFFIVLKFCCKVCSYKGLLLIFTCHSSSTQDLCILFLSTIMLHKLDILWIKLPKMIIVINWKQHSLHRFLRDYFSLDNTIMIIIDWVCNRIFMLNIDTVAAVCHHAGN